jgi:hypothetical protein
MLSREGRLLRQAGEGVRSCIFGVSALLGAISHTIATNCPLLGRRRHVARRFAEFGKIAPSRCHLHQAQSIGRIAQVRGARDTFGRIVIVAIFLLHDAEMRERQSLFHHATS